ncbi:MAG: M60 family metallopeptidase, partial [Planctomycetota bacterium]|nr:M60 family metallopeptidase [Planctomycetota bacterium]
MTYWDEAVAFMDYVGSYESLRTGPERINVDVQISVGLLQAGYPIQGPTWASEELVDLGQLRTSGNWGYFHELGHEMQRRPDRAWGWENPFTFSGDVEVTVNIFANAALERMVPGTGTGGWGYSAHPVEVMTRAVATVNDQAAAAFDAKDPYPFYFQLADGFGWETYRAAGSRSVPPPTATPSSMAKSTSTTFSPSSPTTARQVSLELE